MSRLRHKLIEELEKIPGLQNKPWPGREDGFSSLLYRGKDFAHFHNDNELDIKLTKNVIKREGLVHPQDSNP